MVAKRKRDEFTDHADVVSKPVAGTKSFPTGKAVQEGLAVGTRQGMSITMSAAVQQSLMAMQDLFLFSSRSSRLTLHCLCPSHILLCSSCNTTWPSLPPATRCSKPGSRLTRWVGLPCEGSYGDSADSSSPRTTSSQTPQYLCLRPSSISSPHSHSSTLLS
jgi:hypothetical protein